MTLKHKTQPLPLGRVNTELIFKNLPELITDRLLLRKLKLSDAADMFEYAKNPKVSMFTLWEPHNSIKITKKYIKYVLKNYSAGIPENWGIVLKKRGKLIGTCGYFRVDRHNSSAELHYALSAEYSGMGIMTEAVGKIIGFGFNRLKLNRIEARCMTENAASEKVMQKCGMKFEGVTRQAMLVKGKYRDLKVYAILKKDWNL